MAKAEPAASVECHRRHLHPPPWPCRHLCSLIHCTTNTAADWFSSWVPWDSRRSSAPTLNWMLKTPSTPIHDNKHAWFRASCCLKLAVICIKHPIWSIHLIVFLHPTSFCFFIYVVLVGFNILDYLWRSTRHFNSLVFLFPLSETIWCPCPSLHQCLWEFQSWDSNFQPHWCMLHYTIRFRLLSFWQSVVFLELNVSQVDQQNDV